MRIQRARITKASLPTYWYADRIGDEFYITRFYYRKPTIIPVGVHEERPVDHYLEPEDFEVLEEFHGEVMETVSISIHRNEEIKK